MPRLADWDRDKKAGKEIDPRARDSQELIRRTLIGLSEQLAEHKEKLEAYEFIRTASYSSSRHATSNERRSEARILNMAREKETIQELQRTIMAYISLLRENRVHDWEVKTKILKLRHIDRMEWQDICFEVYGDQEDYVAKFNTYKRKMFRRLEVAYSNIFHYIK